MKYLFNGNHSHVFLEIVADPDDIEKRYTHGWNRAEFLHLVGITIPEDLEFFSMEPYRNIFALKMIDDEGAATHWEDPKDIPQFMKDIWANRDTLRNHVKAAILEQRSPYSSFDFIPETGQIVETVSPDKETRMASSELSRTKIGCRVIIDLVDLLISKGIITLADLPDYYSTGEANLKSIVDRIDWSLM